MNPGVSCFGIYCVCFPYVCVFHNVNDRRKRLSRFRTPALPLPYKDTTFRGRKQVFRPIFLCNGNPTEKRTRIGREVAFCFF